MCAPPNRFVPRRRRARSNDSNGGFIERERKAGMTVIAAATEPDLRQLANDRAFLGHPRGLGYLAFTEAWERFSFYGMQTLLVLYMIHQLLLPGHVENVAGFAPFRSLIEGIYGPLSTQALASAIFGFYASFVYITPMIGGFLADRYLGRKLAVTIGALTMAVGHFLMAFDVSFLIALFCLIAGNGFFKGNLASQVGALYGEDDPRSPDAFQIYVLSIQIGVISAPLVCGTLGELYGWHYGFGAAGIGMLIGLLIFLAGSKYLPDNAVGKAAKADKPQMLARDWKAVAALILLVPLLAMLFVVNNEVFNAYITWASTSFDMHVLGIPVPVTWLVSIDAAMGTATLIGVVAFWRWWGRTHSLPNELSRIVLGGLFGVGAGLILAAAAALNAGPGEKVGLAWVMAFELINGIAFANIYPVAIALFARAAPAAVNATMIGVFMIVLFIANTLVGWLGGYLELMPVARFWLMHAAIMGAALAVLILCYRLFWTHLKPHHDSAPAPAD
jgi:POT family proton-dependent oligopeptide transporter